MTECAGGGQFKEVELDTEYEVLSGKLNTKLLALPYEASASLRQQSTRHWHVKCSPQTMFYYTTSSEYHLVPPSG